MSAMPETKACFTFGESSSAPFLEAPFFIVVQTFAK
jgi:hypothetical protein